jgi:hypothetical protein
MNGLKKFANICESTGVKAATTILNQNPPKFVAGFNLDMVGKISKYDANKIHNTWKVSDCYKYDDCIIVDIIINNKVIQYTFVKGLDHEYLELNEFLEMTKLSSLTAIYNDLKNKINE